MVIAKLRIAMMVRAMRAIVMAAMTLLLASDVGAQEFEKEKLGEWSLSDFLLEPTFTLTEPKRGFFGPGNSYLEASWRLDPMLSARIKIGSRALLGRPQRYGDVGNDDDLTMIEGYGQADTSIGRVRFGLLPLPFGLEGGDSEARLRLPRGLLFEERLVGLRDYGVSYHVSNAGFSSEWAIHNGESGPDLDNEAWLTARWSWRGSRFFRTGVSGTTGRANLAAAPGSAPSPVPPGASSGPNARIRIADLFFEWQERPFAAEVEAAIGETRAGEDVATFRNLRVDLDFEILEGLATLVRYDTLGPGADSVGSTTGGTGGGITGGIASGTGGGGKITEVSLGFAWRNRYETSVFYAIVSRVFEEGVEPDAHRLRLLWRLTPSARARLSAL